ncbi:MAG: dTMP kinase [Planctomycetota bacterium]|nr:dTMP kinase [Planctomycetaceae bacterium]MDQ3329243.1 dTMP kinase [Planctomycetota bacterium]
MRGRLIAIEGIDGAGKGTQAQRLLNRFIAEGRRAVLFSFPRYAETNFGSYIGDYLNGGFGSLDRVHPFLASLLFAGDRFESRETLLEALSQNDAVICDRYVGSNAAHQGARVASQERDAFVARIETVEYEVFRLPRPDVTILLDLSVKNAKRQISTKSPRVYTDQSEDLHEADGDYLSAVRATYRSLAARSPGWRLIGCESDDAVRTVDEIAADVWSAVSPIIDA